MMKIIFRHFRKSNFRKIFFSSLLGGKTFHVNKNDYQEYVFLPAVLNIVMQVFIISFKDLKY